MKLESLFKKTIKLLNEREVQFALAGGFAAGTYRDQHRFTNDIDFLLVGAGDEQEIAQSIIETLGLTPSLARKADLEGGPLFAIKKKNTSVWAVIGRSEKDKSASGLDFLLPNIPWIGQAVINAQNNQISYGGTLVPTVTVEDLIIAKLFALKNNSTRFKDLDDLKSIFLAQNKIDISYVVGRMQEFKLLVPKELGEFCPEQLRAASRLVGRM